MDTRRNRGDPVVKIKNDVFVYVEGGGSGARSASLEAEFRQAFAEFFSKTNLGNTRRPRVVSCGGREQTFDSFCTAIQQGRNALLLVDSEAALDAAHEAMPIAQWKPWAHLQGQAGWDAPGQAKEEDCHLMVQCMENWFLADKASIKNFFGHGFNDAALPNGPLESISKATVYTALQKATQQCKTKAPYGKGAHSFKLLQSLDPAKVEAASPWAKRFLDELRKRKP